MTREQAQLEVRRHWREILRGMTTEAKTKVNGEPSYICPLCGHGTHGDGLTFNRHSKDGNSLKCFGCGFAGDIVDLYMRKLGVTYNTALTTLADSIGITIEPYRIYIANPSTTARQKQPQNAPECPQRAETSEKEKLPMEAKESLESHSEAIAAGTADFTEYYDECASRINDPQAVAYLKARGISVDTAEAYRLGFDPEADPANAPGAIGTGGKLHPAPRIICPTTAAHYIARSIDPGTPKPFQKMNPNRNKGAGETGIFNQEALYAQDAHEIFVTEGFFNALSIMEAGAVAIATNSASNVDTLLKTLEQRPTKATLILAFDNDPAGRKATERMREGLQRLNVSYITAGADVVGKGDTAKDQDGNPGKEDANDLLVRDRESFIEAVQDAQHQTAAKPDNVSWYIENLMTAEIERFKREIKTGFPELDSHAGGLYSGLYVIAAISSLGKTTLAAQMADQIAAAGHDVLFFSMEQSRLELVTKSIARKCFQNNHASTITSLSIRRGYMPPEVRKAAKQYQQEVQDRISIVEGNFNCGISFIGDYIRGYISRNTSGTGERPVVFIDYLQVLQPERQNGRQQTTKEMVDASVTELKRLSRELGITIFVISSVNRANYLTQIDFESLKESGGIEYTADVIWGLQLQCLREDIFDSSNNINERRERVKEAKAESPRKIELSCLKNRYGVSSFSVLFDYYPEHDCFTESEEPKPGGCIVIQAPKGYRLTKANK